MFEKIIISEFFTTINFNLFLNTLKILTYKLPILRKGEDISSFEKELLIFLGTKQSKIVSFYNGRSALYHCLKMIGLNKTNELIISGYTCISVSNAVIQTGTKIIYSDIEKSTLGLDLKELKKNITPKTKVIIVQHTFGKPSNIKEILKLTKNKNILIIEDCAHSLGSEMDNKKLGLYGDFAIFSTGRDKVISSVTGGFLVINNKKFFSKIKSIKQKLQLPSRTIVIRNLFYNILGYKAFITYNFFSLGKIIIYISRKLNLITEILTKNEKECKYKEFNYSFPNSLAFLARKELKKINIYNSHRQKIAVYYDDNINKIKKVFLKDKKEINNYYRYPVIFISIKKRDDFYYFMKKNNILLGNTWSGINIVPIGTNLKNAQYIKGSCPMAEDISSKILTLPNNSHINFKDVKKIVKLINLFMKQ